MKNGRKTTTKTCKKCKKDFKPVLRNGIVVSAICPACVRIKQSGKKKIKKPKTKTLTQLKNKLDKVFSIYIRKSSADKLGYITCVCCGKKLPWQDAQNMHYISRGHMATRWDELNCYAGCVGCNIFKKGNYPAYTEFLLNSYGVKGLESLLQKKNLIKKYTKQELENLITYYEGKI